MAGSKLENNKSDSEAVVDLAGTKKKIKMKKETQKNTVGTRHCLHKFANTNTNLHSISVFIKFLSNCLYFYLSCVLRNISYECDSYLCKKTVNVNVSRTAVTHVKTH